MEPEKTRQPLPTKKKTTCQPTNQSKPANSCETPTPDDSETSTVNPVCQPTNPYENTNSNPAAIAPPTTSIRLETPISKNINLPKMEKVADDLETWRTRSNEKRGEYDAPIARMEASGTGLNRLTVLPVFGTPPRRPWQPWKWKAWQKARERESLASNGFDYIHN